MLKANLMHLSPSIQFELSSALLVGFLLGWLLFVLHVVGLVCVHHFSILLGLPSLQVYMPLTDLRSGIQGGL